MSNTTEYFPIIPNNIEIGSLHVSTWKILTDRTSEERTDGKSQNLQGEKIQGAEISSMFLIPPSLVSSLYSKNKDSEEFSSTLGNYVDVLM